MAIKYLSGNRVTALSTDLVTETTTMAGNSSGTNTGGVDYYTYKQITGLTAGTQISKCILDIKSASTNIKVGIYTDNSNQPSTLISEGVSAVSVSDYTLVEIALDSYATVPSNGKVWVAMKPEAEIIPRKSIDSASYSASVHGGGSYSSAMVSTASINGNGTYNVHFGVIVETPKLGATSPTATLESDDFSESGWAVTGNKFSVSSGKVQCAGYTSHAPNDFVYYDLGVGHNAFDQSFVLRSSMKNVGVGNNGGYLEFGFTSNSGNADSGNMINGSLNHHMSNNKYLRINGAYGGSVYEHTTQSGGDSDLNGTEYIELKFVKSTGVVTLSAYTDNTYSTVESGCSITYTITESNYSSDDMRYVFFGSVTASGRHLHQDSFFDDMIYYSGVSSTAPVDDAVAVPNGSVVEETDTGKHQIWNSTTSTWTEIA